MKKLSFIVIALILIILIGGIYYLSIEPSSEINENQNDLDQTENKKSIIIQGTEISSECQIDNDCSLQSNKPLNNLSCCLDCSNKIIDYSLEEYVAVNHDSYSTWANDKWLGFHEENCKGLECLACIGTISPLDERYKAKCIDNVCQKVYE